ncbi:MAG: aminopeptidase N C-terminal domain-containing protein, partial [Pseudomonadota bacterium]
ALLRALIKFVRLWPDGGQILGQLYDRAATMTVRLAALAGLCQIDGETARRRLDDFYQSWHKNDLVIDHWFRLQSTNPGLAAIGRLEELMHDPCYSPTKPNKVRALLGGFAMANPIAFHKSDGSGYRFMKQRLLELDQLNPQISARLAGCFSLWLRLDQSRARRIEKTIRQMLDQQQLSQNLSEILTRMIEKP